MLHKIQYRFSFIFVIFILCVVIVSGLMLQWTIRQSFENELGLKLVTVAQTSTVLFEPEELLFLTETIGPRLRERLTAKCKQLKERNGVKRIFLFDINNKILIDTEDQQALSPSLGLQFFPNEIEKVQLGEAAHSILFQGIDNKPSMTGFAPFFYENQVVAGIGVEGSVSYLDSMKDIQNRLVGIALGSMILAIITGFILSRTITRPIRELAGHSEKIAKGDYNESIPVSSKDEIGDLAATMEQMRNNILKREEELKAMVAGIAHEIRNPLGGIKLYSDLIADEISENSETQKHIERILHEINHLQNVVSRFLEFANPQHPQAIECDLIQILSECRELLTNKINEKNISVKMPTHEQLTIEADPNHIKEVILNILQNAIQSMNREGKIEITCHSGDHITMEIRDNGPGIPAEAQPDIFNPFFTTRAQGTGLGLSIAKSLMKANGGDLILKASNQSGTIFSLFF